ncbi:MAG TPA: GDSL-type esterase/lipase family protein [Planctomycetota bacterium]|jgi:lysophospholipase L1-like esterase|nr:GDSL-type esterase/lipase family protein [Planctomycetota bacterium]
MSDRWVRIASVVLPRLVFYPFLAASLLVFPAWLPWMILCWFVIAAVRRRRGKAAWPALGLCVGIVLGKRMDWPPALVVLGLLTLAAATLDFLRQRRPALASAATIAGLCLLPAWIWMAWSWVGVGYTSRRPVLDGRPIVCTGDSLTSMGYPRVLERRLRVPVVDHAVGGITSGEGLRIFPKTLALQPQLVIIEIGGHDSIKGKSRAEAKANLEAMIRGAREAGAEVLLFEIPRGFITDRFAGLDRELAREHDLELIHDGAIRQLVFFSPIFAPLASGTGRKLSDDGLHPNAAGNEFLADRVEAALGRIYGGSLRR